MLLAAHKWIAAHGLGTTALGCPMRNLHQTPQFWISQNENK